jgi:hypothetical protein
MKIVTIMRFAGDPDDLLARKQRYVDPVTARVAPTAGGLAHVTAKTPDSLLLINVVESTGSAGLRPEVADALRRSGLPQPMREDYDVCRFVVSPAAHTAQVA